MSLHLAPHSNAVAEAYGACIAAHDKLDANVGRAVLEESAPLMRRAFELFTQGTSTFHATELYDVADALERIVQRQNPPPATLNAKRSFKKERTDAPQEPAIEAA